MCSLGPQLVSTLSHSSADIEFATELGVVRHKFEAHQISILEMMLVTFVCAAAVTLVHTYWIGGTLTLFAVSCIVSGYVSQSSKFSMPKARFFQEVLWGCMMPLACVVTDPFVFTHHGGDPFMPSGFEPGFDPPLVYSIYSLILWQILNLIFSWFSAGTHSLVRAWFVGTFCLGCLFALAIGLILLPFSTIGLVVVVGVLGFTPLITAYVFARTAMQMWDHNVSVQRHRYFAVVLGGAFSLIVPLMMFVILSYYVTW